MYEHLNALLLRLSNERARLANAKTESEKELRKVWIAQIEKEVANEEKLLGIDEIYAKVVDEDELLKELFS